MTIDRMMYIINFVTLPDMEQQPAHSAVKRCKTPSSDGDSEEETCAACVTRFKKDAVGGPHCRDCKARLWCPECLLKRYIDGSDDASPIAIQLDDGQVCHYCLECAKDVLVAHAESFDRKHKRSRVDAEWCWKHCGGATYCDGCDRHICGYNSSGQVDSDGCRPTFYCEECEAGYCKACHKAHREEKHPKDDSSDEDEEEED